MIWMPTMIRQTAPPWTTPSVPILLRVLYETPAAYSLLSESPVYLKVQVEQLSISRNILGCFHYTEFEFGVRYDVIAILLRALSVSLVRLCVRPASCC